MQYFPAPDPHDHKYKRGQVAVLGGIHMTGAACLSADASARIGAGLVTIICPCLTLYQRIKTVDPALIYRSFRPYIIARTNTALDIFMTRQRDKGKVVGVIGPGLGNEEYETVRTIVSRAIYTDSPIVLDADGLNAFASDIDSLLETILFNNHVILTPHEGEFSALFPDLIPFLTTDRIHAANEAANRSGATIVLKGAQTVIAQSNHDAVINQTASPYLATAGSGDVLSGLIAGLIAQGMPVFEASCAAVWIHGKASLHIGAGLVASDIIEKIPSLLSEITKNI